MQTRRGSRWQDSRSSVSILPARRSGLTAVALFDSRRWLAVAFWRKRASNTGVAISHLCCVTCPQVPEWVDATDHRHVPVPVHGAVRWATFERTERGIVASASPGSVLEYVAQSVGQGEIGFSVTTPSPDPGVLPTDHSPARNPWLAGRC